MKAEAQRSHLRCGARRLASEWGKTMEMRSESKGSTAPQCPGLLGYWRVLAVTQIWGARGEGIEQRSDMI